MKLQPYNRNKPSKGSVGRCLFLLEREHALERLRLPELVQHVFQRSARASLRAFVRRGDRGAPRQTRVPTRRLQKEVDLRVSRFAAAATIGGKRAAAHRASSTSVLSITRFVFVA